MTERYFSEETIQHDTAILVGGEAQHLTRVMRAKPGTEVVLFDGSGAEFDAVVQKIQRHTVELRVVARHAVDREAVPIVVGVALPKGDRQRWLVEKMTELGCSRLVPLITARNVSQPTDAALQRLKRHVIEASKQCRRNRLMVIDQPRTWHAWIATPPVDAARWIAHPRNSWPHPIANTPTAVESSCTEQTSYLAIGPEGGFTDDEALAAWSAGWTLVDLGPRILRVETAAIVLVTKIQDHFLTAAR